MLDKEDVWDKSPSEVFRSIKMLAGRTFNKEIVKNLWMRRLSYHINIVLLLVSENPVNELYQTKFPKQNITTRN